MDCILVADPDPACREVVRAAAARAGLQVVWAEHGVEALERFRARTPRFVVVDRLLPILDGLQVATKLRASPTGSTTVLILTGILTTSVTEEERIRLALSDVLEKPYAADDLFRTLASFLAVPDQPVGPAERFLPAEPDRIELAQQPMARLVVEIAAQRRTGELVWWEDRLVKSLFFHEGNVIGAASNGRLDVYPAWAARDPLLGPGMRARIGALASPGPDAQTGECWEAYLEQRGALPREQIHASRSRWLNHLAHELVRAGSGRAGFIDGSTGEEELARIDGEELAIYALRGSPGDGFGALLPRPLTLIRHGSMPPREGLRLSRVEQELLSLADGRHSMGELLALARLVELDVRGFFHGLIALGIVEQVVTGTEDTPVEIARLPESTEREPPAPSGKLRKGELGRLLVALSGLGKTGILQLARADSTRWVHVESGRIVHARSNREGDRLGEVLLASGLISEEDHGRALSIHSAEPERRIGATLLELGALSLKELHEGLQLQVRGILHDVQHWDEGSYSFLEGALPSDEMVSIDVSTPNLLLELMRGVEPDPRAMAELASAATRVCRVWTPARTAALLCLDRSEQALLEAVGKEARFEDLVASSGLSAVDAFKALSGLIAIGCLGLGSGPAAAGEAEAVSADSGEADVETLSFRALGSDALPQLIALRAANRELTTRIAALERENHRLRQMLVTGATLCV